MWHSHFGTKLPHELVQSGTDYVGKRTWASSGQQETGRGNKDQPLTGLQ